PATGSLDGSNVDLLHLHHRLKRALGFIPAGIQRFGEGARGDLPGEAPFVAAPTALAFLPAVVDDGIPVAVGFFLIVGGNLERKRLAVGKERAAVQAEARDAEDGKVYGQHVTSLARGKVGGGAVDGADLA